MLIINLMGPYPKNLTCRTYCKYWCFLTQFKLMILGDVKDLWQVRSTWSIPGLDHVEL